MNPAPVPGLGEPQEPLLLSAQFAVVPGTEPPALKLINGSIRVTTTASPNHGSPAPTFVKPAAVFWTYCAITPGPLVTVPVFTSALICADAGIGPSPDALSVTTRQR